MRHSAAPYYPDAGQGQVNLASSLGKLWPYLWRYRLRVILALVCLVAAKCANVAVPMIFKQVVDGLTPGDIAVVLPGLLLIIYGVLRFSTSLFTELRELLFIRVTQRVVRQIALDVFEHLHALSLRFHLERQTGGVSRDIERGSRAISSLISYSLYSILPTLVELTLVLTILYLRYPLIFVWITLLSLLAYVAFTIIVTKYRTQLRRAVNEADSAANTRAIDSLINYETVKYFNNEHYEATRYDHQLERLEAAANDSQRALALLNLGQQAIIAIGVTAMMWVAADGVVKGQMTLGDLVLVNAFLIQLYVPLNFLGVIYREIRQAIIDIERLFGLLAHHREIADVAEAVPLPPGVPDIVFADVGFSYDGERAILKNLSLTIPAGKKYAVVGASGSGKSTLARLLFRFYDIDQGGLKVGGVDVRQMQQSSLRRAIGIVPQDATLFNDTIYYNILYGRPEASQHEVFEAARAAQLHDFILGLPQGYETRVGERGLKLSGGEKQRVAIARALLKNPVILIFDEATSALDSATELAIQRQLDAAAVGRTTLVIAHRLSTIMNADWIVVLAGGEIVEQGCHQELLKQDATYAQMWRLQDHGETQASEPNH